jgi:hypothetical protein
VLLAAVPVRAERFLPAIKAQRIIPGNSDRAAPRLGEDASIPARAEGCLPEIKRSAASHSGKQRSGRAQARKARLDSRAGRTFPAGNKAQQREPLG